MSRKKNREKPLKSSVEYFERVISGHTAVANLNEVSENVYEIERTGGRPPIRVLVADIYVVSEADIFEIVTTNYDLTCVLLIGFYNRYSSDAKERAKAENLGLFNMKEFFGAINYIGQKLINYEPKTKDN
ncbi:MAG: hypothetical protein GX361_00485 [Bacteroidales bacterium]|nr:hypothetical protein [Bacteroidales bacterium]